MLYQIINGTVSLGGREILSHINFEIKGSEKIAVTGINGAGKTTLLRLLAGELDLDRDDKRQGAGIFKSRRLTVEMLSQQAFSCLSRTVEEELLESCPEKEEYAMERFAYEREYDRLFTGFGFRREEKRKRLSQFSGGEQTKIALIRLLLEKPDVLLLDVKYSIVLIVYGVYRVREKLKIGTTYTNRKKNVYDVTWKRIRKILKSGIGSGSFFMP